MQAIIFESNTGHTKRYAQMLSNITGIPAYSRKEIPKTVKKHSDIIYMGWILGNGIKGFASVAKRYNVKAVCATGISSPNEKVLETLREQNRISDDVKLFYLRGGIDISELHGVHALMMKLMKKGLEKSDKLDDGEREMLDILNNSPDFVSEDNLKDIVLWCGK